MFNIWDMASKNRLKASPSVGGPITATAWNNNGSRWAYAVGYDWSKGYAFNKGVENKVLVHHFAPDVIKPKLPKKR
jgi:mRNA export factor